MLYQTNKSSAKRTLFWLAPILAVSIFILATFIPAGLASPSVAPTLTDMGPEANDPAVSVSADITATFGADPDPASVDHTTFAVHSSFYGLVTGTLAVNTNQITLNPADDFKVGDQVQVIATAGITNADGPLDPTHQWGFMTGQVANRCFGTFVDSGEIITGVALGGGQWIDVDGDSDLDVVVTGQAIGGLQSQIVLNDGLGSFSDSGAADDALITVRDGSLAVGDYNNDGHPDILLAGLADGFVPSVQVGRNTGGSFVDSVPDDSVLPPISESAAAWGDYNNDGDIDLLLSGGTAVGAIANIYRNNAGTLIASGGDDDNLPLVKDSAAAWGDYNNDGYLDLVITGDSTSGLVGRIFRNDPGILDDRVLVDSGAADNNLIGVKDGSVAWADIDGDGDLDLALSGLGAGGPQTKIYENDLGTFVDNGDVLIGVTQSDMAFGDYDNDGDLDLAVIGRDITGPTAVLYDNDGSGSFSRNMQADANLTAVANGSISFGDADGDGDIDLLMTGESDLGAVSKIFTNEGCSIGINGPAPLFEGDAGNTSFDFEINRTGDVSTTVMVDYTVVPSGTHPADAADLGGSFASGTATLGVGETTENITINVSGDNSVEEDETFHVVLSNPTAGSKIGVPFGVGTIRNDDSRINISAAAADTLEGDAGDTAFTFTITRSGYINRLVSFDYTITGDANGTDFSAGLTGMHSIPGLSSSNVLTINVSGDGDVEPDENFTVTISNPSPGGEIGTSTAMGTIRNDDGDHHITVLDAVKDEGDSGNTSFTFEILRSGAITTSQTTIDYAVSAGGGANPANAADFGGVFASDTVTFTTNMTREVVTVNVSGDHTFEPDETFDVTLSNVTGGGLIGIATATGTIQNDDTGLEIAAADAAKDEGSSGTTDFTFTVDRIGNVSGSHSVSYTVSAGGGANPADGADFGGSFPSGTVSFSPTETSKMITVSVSADTTVEADETFTVTLSNPTNNANILTADAAGTIENDDGTVSIDPDGLSQVEGDSGTITYTYSATLSSAAVVPVSVDYSVAGTGANPANVIDLNGSFPSGTLNFGIGEMTKQIEVTVSGDTDTESDETFIVTLSNPTAGFTLDAATATSTIENDDRSLSISVIDAVKDEGDSGTTAFTFLVTRSGLSTGAVTADYAVILNNSAADDFSGDVVPSGTISLADGQITGTISIEISGDTTVEPTETFDVELSNPSGATLQTSRVTGIIQNDDSGFSIAAVTSSQPEGDSGFTTYQFTIQRNGLAAGNSSVTYTVSGIGADPADAADFGGLFDSAQAFFQDGMVDQMITIQVQVTGDTDIEADETFVVTLSNPTGGEVISTATAMATIENDDNGIRIAALPGEQSQAEGDSGTTSFDYTLYLVGSYTQTVTVDYAVSGSSGAPANGADFDGGTYPMGTISFPVGVITQSLTIPVQGDTDSEPDEEFTITLANPTGGAVLGAATITGTIENDEPPSTSTTIFLPVIRVPQPPTPDLIVDSITISDGSPTVVIRNIGTGAVTTDFWVDLYINPSPPPTQVNETIDTLQSDGMTWGIKNSLSLLPLDPNESLTLTLSSSSVVTTTTTTIPAGATVYVQVDSASTSTNYGGVHEGHEIENGPYNNISSITNN